MRAELNGGEYSVLVDNDEVRGFMASWPCSGLDEAASYRFTFSASSGDLVDLAAFREDGREDGTERDDGSALAALGEDAGRFGAESLALGHVMDLRYASTAPAP